MPPDIALDLGPQRAGGDREGDVDGHVVAADRDGPDHAEVDDRVAQLGVDDRAQALEHLVCPGSGRVSAAGGGGGDPEVMWRFYLRGDEFRPDRLRVPRAAWRR